MLQMVNMFKKVLGENDEKCVFCFCFKTAGIFWPTQYYKLAFSKNCERKFLNLEWKGLTFFEIWWCSRLIPFIPPSPTYFFISWRLIPLQYYSGFYHTLTWISHGFTCISHPDAPSHLPLYLIPLGLPSAPGPSTCLMHPTWAGDLFHPR